MFADGRGGGLSARPLSGVILLVDDKPANLYALERVLQGVPAHIVTATSGNDALSLTLRHEIVLAILDVQMPEMDGYELAELLRGNPSTAKVPIIFVSAAYADEQHRDLGYESGAVDYLVKPIDPGILRGKVQVFLELARTRAELERLLAERTRALDAKAAQLELRSRLKSVLSGVSREMAARRPEDARAAVVAALGRVANFVEASRACVTFTPARADAAVLGLEWASDTADAPLLEGCRERLQALFLREAGHVRAHFSVENVARWAEVDETTSVALASRRVARLLWFPLTEDERMVGGLAFAWESARIEAWARSSEMDVADALSLLGELILNALQRAEAEAGRLESEAQHLRLFATMSQGVVYQDAGGAILAVNPAAERMFGRSKAEFSDWAVAGGTFDVVREDGVPFAVDAHPVVEALRTGRPVDGVLMGVQNPVEGGRRWLIVSAVPLFREGTATPFQVYATCSDLTELIRSKEVKERLVRAEAESRAKSRFLASMSHEIRTPMNAILGYTHLLLRDVDLAPRQRDYLETIGRSGEHLIGLVNNVLDMARIESGAEVLDPSLVDVHDILTDVERMFRLRAAQLRLKFRVERQIETPGRLNLDAGKVRQVLINLLGNAMKFTPRGSVTMRARTLLLESGRVRLTVEVQDSGIGIAEAHIEDVFEPFVQVSRSAASVGAGVGLSVCRRFARLMGGDVTVTSTLGRASTFRFEICASTGDVHVPRELTRVVGLAPGSPPFRVLVIDADLESRASLLETLTSVGILATEASALEDGVTALRKGPFELVIADLRRGSGVSALLMEANVRGLPLLRLVTATADRSTDVPRPGSRHGVLCKPVKESVLFLEITRTSELRFVYEGDDPASTDGERTGDAPSGERRNPSVAGLTDAGREGLLAALRGGYPRRIAEQVQRIEQEAPELGAEIRQMAEAFEYTGILTLLKECG